MSSQDPFGSTTPPERPTNPTHFGGERAYESKSQTAETSDSSDDSLLKVPRVEHVDTATRDSFVDDTTGRGSSFEFVKRNHLHTLLAVGGVAWLLWQLVPRSTGRQ
jgi:hypothetical protein